MGRQTQLCVLHCAAVEWNLENRALAKATKHEARFVAAARIPKFLLEKMAKVVLLSSVLRPEDLAWWQTGKGFAT